MRKALSGILTSLLLLTSLVGISAPGNADESVQQYSNKFGADIQPYDRSDREVTPDNTYYRAPENVNPPADQPTRDADSYRQPPQRSHRFGAESAYGIYRYGR